MALEAIQKESEKVTLNELNDGWQLVAEPLQEYVYLHPLWYRIATLDFYKIECERRVFDASTILDQINPDKP